jgi:pentafunctional AROM polypeptide
LIFFENSPTNDENPQLEEIKRNCNFILYLFDIRKEENKEYNRRLLHYHFNTKEEKLPVELQAGKWSHYLSLTHPDLSIVSKEEFLSLRKGVDAMELRVDLLANHNEGNVLKQISLIRRQFPSLPIMFTVRTKHQLGNYPDPESAEDFQSLKNLLLLGVKAGCQWIDLEASLPKEFLAEIVQMIQNDSSSSNTNRPKISSTSSSTPATPPVPPRLIGSYHTTSVCSSEELSFIVSRCDLSGAASLLKIVTGAREYEDIVRLQEMGKKHSSTSSSGSGQNSNNKKPFIGLSIPHHSSSDSSSASASDPQLSSVNFIGSYSQLFNQRFTPVTHELLPRSSSSSSLLTVKQLMQKRIEMGLIPAKKEYFLFGHPIQYCLSPKIQNTAFEMLSLPFNYSILEKESVADYQKLLSGEESLFFGGASVSVPHKETIIEYLHELSPEVKEIGAVNTIVARRDCDCSGCPLRMIGYNTEWKAIYRPLSLLLKKEREREREKEKEMINLLSDNHNSSTAVVASSSSSSASPLSSIAVVIGAGQLQLFCFFICLISSLFLFYCFHFIN